MWIIEYYIGGRLITGYFKHENEARAHAAQLYPRCCDVRFEEMPGVKGC